jgi:very-short-patch-repair endonuclease
MIELDGGQHVDQSGYDQARTEWLESKGYRVVRFWNNDVLRNIENVKDAIWQTLHTNAQPPSQPSPCQGEGAGGPRFA